MKSDQIREIGGAILCLSGIAGAAVLTQDQFFGFILPILYLMVMGIGLTSMGLLALMKPKLAPVAGVVGIFLAVDTFVLFWDVPLFAVPAVIGGVLCIGGTISGKFESPSPQKQ